MSETSDSLHRNRSPKNSSAPDVAHGVAANSSKLWPISPMRGTATVIINYRFKNGTDTKKDAVRQTIHTDNKPPGINFVTWEDCANVQFKEVKDDEPYQILITFEPVGEERWYSSKVGKDANKAEPEEPTMILEGLLDECPPNEEHRAHLLHEFGHALGLEHEHQSPARQGWFEPNRDAVINSDEYKGNEAKAKRNVLDIVADPTNYTQIDKKSIMLYTIPLAWQNTPWYNPLGRKIVANKELSDIDQAFIQLLYPPDLTQPGAVEPFLQAMITAGLDDTTAADILNAFTQLKGDPATRLTAMRDKFILSTRNSLSLTKGKDVRSRGIYPASLKQFGVRGIVGEVTKDKLFQGIVKNIVYRGVQQCGIPTKVSLPGSSQKEMMNMLGALAMHDDVGRYIKYYDNQLSK